MTAIRVVIAGTAALVAAGALAGAAWWFLVREDAQLATSAPAIPQELVESTQTPTNEVEVSDAAATAETVTFSVNADLSEAAYFVNEELARIGLPSTAKGSTTEIDGVFHLTGDGTELSTDAPSQFTVDLTNLTSDETMRDTRVQEALETSTYPTAAFTVSSVSGYDPSIAEGEEQSLFMTGLLDLHGVQREVTWEVKALREGNVISALATVTIAFSDFDITVPTFAGLVSIDDEATLQVQLIAEAR
jgi:polyisoprenoid-binding protein YceI